MSMNTLKKTEATGKNINEAKAKAAELLGVDEEQIEFEVLENATIGDDYEEVKETEKPEEEPESDSEKETGIEEESGFQPGIDVIKAEQIFEEERKKALDEAEIIKRAG